MQMNLKQPSRIINIQSKVSHPNSKVNWHCPWLYTGIVTANLFLSFICKGIVKKQSFKSKTIKDQFCGIKAGEGRPNCKAHIGFIHLLTSLKSVNILHLPDFFLMTKTGEFQAEVEGSIWPDWSCSSTNCSKALSFTFGSSHCSTHLGTSVNHFNGRARGIWAVATSFPTRWWVLFLKKVKYLFPRY